MGRLYKKDIELVDFISIVWFASVLSLGGLKFFVFNSAFNIAIALSGCLILILNFKFIYFNVKAVLFLVLFLFFYFFIFLSFFYELSDTDITYVMKIVSLVMFSFSAFILSRNIVKNPLILSLLLASFGAFMSVLFLIKYIKPSGAGELSYLNLALPIGIGILSAVYSLLQNKSGVLRKVFILTLIAIQAVAILSLSARMVLISVALLIFITAMRNIGNNKWVIISALIVGCIIFYFLDGLVPQSDFLIFKIERLLDNYKDEPRFYVYIKSIELIINNPFGYGLQSYYKLLGFYPHNIFIEIMMSSGIFAFVIFLILFFYAFSCSAKIFFNRELSIYAMIFIYFTIQWSFSYDLSASYALLSSLCVVSGIVLNKVHINEIKRCNNDKKQM